MSDLRTITSDNPCRSSRAARTGIRVATVVLIGLGAIAWTSHAQQSTSGESKKISCEEIRVRRVVVVDENGREGAALGFRQDGEVELGFRDNKGKLQTWLNPYGVAGPSFAVMGSAENRLIELDNANGRAPVFAVRDIAGRARIMATVTRRGDASVMIYDTHGKVRSMMTVNDAGEPLLTLKDRDGKAKGNLMIQKDGTCALDLRDAKGRTRLTVQLDDRGQPALIAWDSTGKALWSAPKVEKE